MKKFLVKIQGNNDYTKRLEIIAKDFTSVIEQIFLADRQEQTTIKSLQIDFVENVEEER